MKFKKKIEMCRWDDETPMLLLQRTRKAFKITRDCGYVIDGICNFDKKKCKVVVYERIDK